MLLIGDRDSATTDPTVPATEPTVASAPLPANPQLERFGPDVVAEWLGEGVPLLADAFVGVSFLTALAADAPPAEAVQLCQRAVSADQIAADVPVLVFDIDGNLVADGGGELGPCEAVDPDEAPLDVGPGESG
ncbi:hypothetical protein [Euzebya pacifica]|uniref:hypothetical protein n=1 Tax=Euzebya pacifica TaxID=1608957 RepID=UPI0013DE7D50|nr:hypothetical protein [Euzebya pacifica]